MKNSTFLAGIFLAIFTMSCTADKDDTQEVLSEWRLIEVNLSSGGESSFVSTDIDEVITFYTDSKIMRNTAWCADSDDLVTNYSQQGEIFTRCGESNSLNFVIEGDIMIISDPTCIEICEYKYQREEIHPLLGSH